MVVKIDPIFLFLFINELYPPESKGDRKHEAKIQKYKYFNHDHKIWKISRQISCFLCIRVRDLRNILLQMKYLRWVILELHFKFLNLGKIRKGCAGFKLAYEWRTKSQNDKE